MLQTRYYYVTNPADRTCKPYYCNREWISTGAEGARTRRSLEHHLLHPLILRLLVLCAPAVMRPRALQDTPAPTDPKF